MKFNIFLLTTAAIFVSTYVSAEERQLASATYPKTDESGTATSGGPFKFSGFFDFRYSSLLAKDNPTVVNDNAESGFGLEDGAFFLNYEKDKVSVVGELAFRRAKDSDTDAGASTPGQSSNNAFAVGVDKSQLYLRYKINSNLTADFGQFASLYGIEAADSKDRIFGKTGIVGDSMLPATNAGFMLEYSAGKALFKVMASNPNSKGTNGSSVNRDDKSEYGATLGFATENWHGQLGYLSRSILKADSSKMQNRVLTEVILGYVNNKFALDLEYDVINDPNKNSLTSSDNTDLEDSGLGLVALASYKPSEDYVIGLRYENLKNDPAGVNLKDVITFGTSLHYKLSSDVELRAEYIGYDYTTLSDVKFNDTRYNFASIISF